MGWRKKRDSYSEPKEPNIPRPVTVDEVSDWLIGAGSREPEVIEQLREIAVEMAKNRPILWGSLPRQLDTILREARHHNVSWKRG